ncbi:MAG: hypothetical protein SGPRY_001194 [Prymnesium sp.]
MPEKKVRRSQEHEPAPVSRDASSHDGEGQTQRSKSVIRKKTLSKKKGREFQAEMDNRGVIYISRIPPPEDTAVRARRLRAGGNKKKSFTEGWVEFANKRRAKRIASTLNSSPMDPQNHRSFYASDLWNVRYLPKFKWHHLTEKVAADARARQEKMRAELSQAKKETSFYLKKVDQAKALDAMEERKRKRSEAAVSDASPTAGEPDGKERPRTTKRQSEKHDQEESSSSGMREIRRRFKQRKVANDHASQHGVEEIIEMLAHQQ